MKLLFVSHDASRTGAPMVLYCLVKWLKENTGHEISVCFLRGGPLLEKFLDLNVNVVSLFSAQRVLRKIPFIGFRDYLLQKHIDFKFGRYDMVVFNTVDSLSHFRYFEQNHALRKIIYIHENEYSIESMYESNVSNLDFDLVSHLVFVSNSTDDYFVRKFPVVQNKRSVIYEFIDLGNVNKASGTPLLETLMGDDGSFTVLGSGVANWRKGFDLFLQTAIQFKELYPSVKVRFVWMGKVSHDSMCQFNYERKRIDLSNVLLIGEQENPYYYMNQADVFFLSSREDPFPLVCLEAAASSKPIICFEDSGGMPEFVDSNIGFVAPYGDLVSVSRFIQVLINDEGHRLMLGRNAFEKVKSFDVNLKAPEFYDILLKFE